jgi:hypothetical protein
MDKSSSGCAYASLFPWHSLHEAFSSSAEKKAINKVIEAQRK